MFDGARHSPERKYMAAEKNKATDWWGNLGAIILILLLYDWGSEVWHSKLRYVIQYQVGFAKVVKPMEPHDCEWLSAPLGNKNCHYEAQVQSIRTSTSTEAKPIVSYDEGKTWVANEGVPPVESRVFVTWLKIEE
jgi:hypothetical protein